MRRPDHLWLKNHNDDHPMKHSIFLVLLFALPVIGSCSDRAATGAEYFTKQVIHHFSQQTKIPIDETSIHTGDAIAKQRIEFFNKDFKTDNFSNATTVSYMNYLSTQDKEPIHLGVASLEFSNCTDLEKSYSSVTSSNRSNFMIKVLTRFIVLKRDKTLIFIYSETPFQSDVRTFMNTAKDIETAQEKCGE